MKRRQVVLVGGGHANVQVLKQLVVALTPRDKVDVTLVSDQATSYYSGMLPGCISGLYRVNQIQIQLEPLCKYCKAKWIQATMVGIDRENKRVLINKDGVENSVPYDIVAIDIGSTTKDTDSISNLSNVPYIISTRPISKLIEKLDLFETYFRQEFEASVQREPSSTSTPTPSDPLLIRIVVVGGGAAGLELAWATKARFRNLALKMQITIVDSDKAQVHEEKVGSWVYSNIRKKLQEKGIEMIDGVRSDSIDATSKTCKLSNGTDLSFDLLILATGAAASPVLSKLGLPLDEKGFLKVRPTLQSEGDEHVLGGGDCVSIAGCSWVTKAGVYAVREGPILAANILSLLRSQPLQPYVPQKGFLSLLMTGDGEAIVAWKGWTYKGSLAWKLKDKIDTNFMNLFDVSKLPPSTATYHQE